MKGAKVLVHDSSYTAEEYGSHRGWGHSTYGEAVDLALEADVGTLVLFHHKPERSDDELDQRVEECRKRVKDRGAALTVIAAAEGMQIDV
jgi:ribonuclease BN (tRNA processing enzyme)